MYSSKLLVVLNIKVLRMYLFQGVHLTCVTNTDGKKEIMGNENGRKIEKCFDIPRGQVKDQKVNKRYNKSSTGVLKEIEKEVLVEEGWLGNLQRLLRCPFETKKTLTSMLHCSYPWFNQTPVWKKLQISISVCTLSRTLLEIVIQ